MDRNIGFLVNRMNERVLAGQSIETLLAVSDVRHDGHRAGAVEDRGRIADDDGQGLWPVAGWFGGVDRDRGRVPWPPRQGLWARRL